MLSSTSVAARACQFSHKMFLGLAARGWDWCRRIGHCQAKFFAPLVSQSYATARQCMHVIPRPRCVIFSNKIIECPLKKSILPSLGCSENTCNFPWSINSRRLLRSQIVLYTSVFSSGSVTVCGLRAWGRPP
jgi:hypothetical protein